jgi:hypothetical protein
MVFGHCLLSLSQLLFLFFKSRFGAVTRPFNVVIQCRNSFSTKSARTTDFLPEELMRAAMWDAQLTNAVPGYLFRTHGSGTD